MAQANATADAESAALKAYTQESSRRHFGYALVTGVGTLLSILGGPIGSLVGYTMVAGAAAKRAYNGLRNIGHSLQKKYKQKRGSFALAGIWETIKAGVTYVAPYATMIWDGIVGSLEYKRNEPICTLDYDLWKHKEVIGRIEAAAAQRREAEAARQLEATAHQETNATEEQAG